MARKNRIRLLVFVLLVLAFAATQDRYLMRRLLRRPGPVGTVKWQTSLDDAVKIAERENKPIFVDFFATWCGPCEDMLNTTYRDPLVVQTLNEKFVPVLIDVDKQPALAARFGVDPIPDEAFVSSDGQRQLVRTVGEHDTDAFLDLTDQALKEAAKPAPPPRTAHGLSSASGPTLPAPMPAFPPGIP